MKKKESPNHLLPHYYTDLIEAGCDEAGRGCLAGSVYAAAVILPPDYDNPALNDSKKLSGSAVASCATRLYVTPWLGLSASSRRRR